MARTTDPTGLAPDEARTFRDQVREIKADYGITSYDLSDLLEGIDPAGDWTERKITNALAEGRPLLAETARQILHALRPTAAQEHAGKGQPWKRYFNALALNSNCWLQRQAWNVLGPAVFVPPREAEKLAALLASRIVQVVPGIGARQRDKIVSAIKSELKKAGPHMAEHWCSKTTNVVVTGIAEAVQSGSPAPSGQMLLLVPGILRLACELDFPKKPGP